MKFINNWTTTLTADLSALGDTLPISSEASNRLDLSGVYWLTITDTENTRWEIVEVSAGLSIERGIDGTLAQDWQAGATVYCTVTAGQLESILSRLDALEQNGGGEIGEGLTDESGNTLTDQNGNILID